MRDRVRLVAGAIFVVAGLAKFVLNGWELDAFHRFGLPAPQAWVIAAGVLETGGGILLLRRRHVALVAALLAVTMAVAVGVSGFGAGDVIPSLTLAPALLLAMLFLLRGELATLAPVSDAWVPAAAARIAARAERELGALVGDLLALRRRGRGGGARWPWPTRCSRPGPRCERPAVLHARPGAPTSSPA